MSRLLRTVGAAATIVAFLAGCGGGGGASSTPATASKAATQLPLPPASGRKSVGTGTLTLVLPKALQAKNAQAVKALPRSASATGRRGAQFVDPISTPGPGPCAGNNVIDIYVDETLEPNLDGNGETNDSLCVQNTSDGTQTASVALYSTQSNRVVVVEYDGEVANILALGETNYGSFAAGSTISLAVTLQMQADGVGITDLNFDDPQLMYGQYYYGLYADCGEYVNFGLYPTDANGVFVPTAGYGGTTVPTITSQGPPGESTVTASSVPGVYTWNVDSNCDSVTINVKAANPAYAIYNDVENGNYSNYYDAFYYDDWGGTYPNAPNQGIWNLVTVYGDNLRNNFNQTNVTAATGSVTISDGG